MSDAALPYAYERVLRIWEDVAPQPAARARAALDILLGDLRRSADSDRFRRSTLTRTGSPFEPAFSSGTPGLRYTVDPAPPSVGVRDRLDYALSLLARLQPSAPRPQLIRRLAPLQAKGELRYGAQIGVRHAGATDVYKLYVELPREAEAAAEALGQELLGSPPVLNVPGRDARPTLVGIDLTTRRWEIYYRIENLHPREIGTLLTRAKTVARAREVLAMIADSQPLPIRHELPGSTWGFSYLRAANDEITFSIYTFARTLFGPDGWARAGVLSMGRRHGWDLGSYERMTEPLAGYRGPRCHHGIFGLVVPPGRPPAAWIGFAPPDTR